MIKNIFKFIFIIYAILNSSVSFASPSDELSSALNSMKSMKSDFMQTTYDNRGKALQYSSGNLAFIRPGKFRWEAKKPIPQLIIANGNRLWVVDPDLLQVTIRKVNREFGETPTMLLSENVVQLEKRFIVTSMKEGSFVTYMLRPRKRDSTFQLIELKFKNNQITNMKLEDQLGHHTQIQFKNVMSNPKLSQTLFQYTPSREMDVIQAD